tara:strand:- start:111 stop:581 length:471 start_codon:yes stop_codon:yes gene_type:complete
MSDLIEIAGTDVANVTRENILNLETAIKNLPDSIGEQEALETLNDHVFAPGVYARVMTLPAGMTVVGKIHKYAHICLITHGTVKIVSEFDSGVYSAPRVWISEPGVKRTLHALSDFQMVNILPNPSDTQDLDEIEAKVIAKNYKDLDEFLNNNGDS